MKPIACSGMSGIDPDVNDALWQQLVDAQQHPDDEIGHDLVQRAPLVEAVADDATIRQAVEAIIGPNIVDRCMHLHLNSSPVEGDWHVDDYDGAPWPGRFAIVCYFPQATPAAMGPTVTRSGLGPEAIAGAFLAMRHDVEHRAEANTAGHPRLMVKLLYRAVP